MRYIGSKGRLLDEIEKIVNTHATDNDHVFLDLFAGTNIVGRHFKSRFTVFSNDILYFSYVNAMATIYNNQPLAFRGLQKIGINNPLIFLQDHADEEAHRTEYVGYYERSYSPTGEAMYITTENAKRIDYIRQQIEIWKSDKTINETEYYYLLAVLLDAIPYVSNITGTYGAFLKKWDKRALNKLELMPLEVPSSDYKGKCFNEDANTLVKELSVDIAYIDTPYNSRQYAANYHLLENIARNEQPQLKGKTKIFPWSDLRSQYCSKKTAIEAFQKLIRDLDARHIIVSYNSEGLLSESEISYILSKASITGDVEITHIPFKKYMSKIKSTSDEVKELLFYIQKKPPISHTPLRLTTRYEHWTGPSPKYIKSPTNYIGGKYKLLPQILPLFPKDINTFYDLFSGGANVGINVQAQHHVFHDMNSKINDIFRLFQSTDINTLISEIHSVIDKWGLSKTNKDAFLSLRKYYNEHPTPLLLYVLSCYSYNYQFRFNAHHQYNNPFGMNRSQFSENMEKNLRLFVDRLQSIDAIFLDGYFEEFPIKQIRTNDFVYLDPPYLITTGSYNDGTRGFKDWNIAQEELLYTFLQTLIRNKIRFALSNVIEHKGQINTYLTHFIEQEEVYVTDIKYSYANSSHNTKRSPSREIIVTNYTL